MTGPRKFLVVVTAGGRTNATPLFELARILSSRGHTIEFATLEGQEKWAVEYPFISNVHVLGPGPSVSDERSAYKKMSEWKLGLWHSFAPIMETRMYLEASWVTVYPSLSAMLQDPSLRPDFIIADYLVDAVRDMQVEEDIPIAMHWPQMPTNALPASYIPGAVGLQIEVLTSEYATMWQRLQNYLLAIRALMPYLRYRRWVRRMRAKLGVHRSLPSRPKPDHLLLVNSFFGLEPAKDIPPNVAVVGPILSESYPNLTPDLQSFMDSHDRVVYISLGTHVILPDKILQQIVHGSVIALHKGTMSHQVTGAQGRVDGIIWSIRDVALQELNPSTQLPFHPFCRATSDLISGLDPDFLCVPSVPQRALLAHPSLAVFVTHAGASSTNEAVFHGVRTVTIGVYFDQLTNSMKLRDAGTSILLDKDSFSGQDLANAISDLLTDVTGDVAANCERMMHIARIAARRKFLAADLIEETLIDFEGRRNQKRAMHLEPPDVRMPIWKARNWDLWALGVGCGLVFIGIVLGAPIGIIQS